MSFVYTALFGRLRPFIRVETYDRDGGHRRPRHRIELRSDAPPALNAEALAYRGPCAACGKPIQVWRIRGTSQRGKTGHVYFAAACPLKVNVGCSRGYAASNEYENVVEAVSGSMGAQP